MVDLTEVAIDLHFRFMLEQMLSDGELDVVKFVDGCLKKADGTMSEDVLVEFASKWSKGDTNFKKAIIDYGRHLNVTPITWNLRDYYLKVKENKKGSTKAYNSKSL